MSSLFRFRCLLFVVYKDGSIWRNGASTYLQGGGFGRQSGEADDIREVDSDIIESLR